MEKEQQKALDELAKKYAAMLGPPPTKEELELLKKLGQKEVEKGEPTVEVEQE